MAQKGLDGFDGLTDFPDPSSVGIVERSATKYAAGLICRRRARAVAGDRPAIELRPDLASLLGMKSEDKLGTLCGHKAVLLLGRISF